MGRQDERAKERLNEGEGEKKENHEGTESTKEHGGEGVMGRGERLDEGTTARLHEGEGEKKENH